MFLWLRHPIYLVAIVAETEEPGAGIAKIRGGMRWPWSAAELAQLGARGVLCLVPPVILPVRTTSKRQRHEARRSVVGGWHGSSRSDGTIEITLPHCPTEHRPRWGTMLAMVTLRRFLARIQGSATVHCMS